MIINEWLVHRVSLLPLTKSENDTPCTFCKVSSFIQIITAEKTSDLFKSCGPLCLLSALSVAKTHFGVGITKVSDLKDKEHIFYSPLCQRLLGCHKSGRCVPYSSLVLAFPKTHFIPAKADITKHLLKPDTLHPWSVLPLAMPASRPLLVGLLMSKIADEKLFSMLSAF